MTIEEILQALPSKDEIAGSIGLLLIGSIMAFWMKPNEGLDGPTSTIDRAATATAA